MGAHLERAAVQRCRVPALAQLLDGAHVDAAVVQPVLDLGQVAVEEAPVHSDRVATQRHGARLGHMLLDERQRGGARFVEGDGGGADGVGEAALGVHFDHHLVHHGQRLVGLVDNEVGPLGDDVQFVVGDDGGDLDDHVHRRIEAGHLQVHPHEHDRQH